MIQAHIVWPMNHFKVVLFTTTKEGSIWQNQGSCLFSIEKDTSILVNDYLFLAVLIYKYEYSFLALILDYQSTQIHITQQARG